MCEMKVLCPIGIRLHFVFSWPVTYTHPNRYPNSLLSWTYICPDRCPNGPLSLTCICPSPCPRIFCPWPLVSLPLLPLYLLLPDLLQNKFKKLKNIITKKLKLKYFSNYFLMIATLTPGFANFCFKLFFCKSLNKLHKWRSISTICFFLTKKFTFDSVLETDPALWSNSRHLSFGWDSCFHITQARLHWHISCRWT